MIKNTYACKSEDLRDLHTQSYTAVFLPYWTYLPELHPFLHCPQIRILCTIFILLASCSGRDAAYHLTSDSLRKPASIPDRGKAGGCCRSLLLLLEVTNEKCSELKWCYFCSVLFSFCLLIDSQTYFCISNVLVLRSDKWESCSNIRQCHRLLCLGKLGQGCQSILK